MYGSKCVEIYVAKMQKANRHGECIWDAPDCKKVFGNVGETRQRRQMCLPCAGINYEALVPEEENQ